MIHFKEKNDTEKALKHMNKFMEKLEKETEKGFVSKYAFNLLNEIKSGSK